MIITDINDDVGDDVSGHVFKRHILKQNKKHTLFLKIGVDLTELHLLGTGMIKS